MSKSKGISRRQLLALGSLFSVQFITGCGDDIVGGFLCPPGTPDPAPPTNGLALARQSDIAVQVSDADVFLHDHRNEIVFRLHPATAVIWNYCDGEHDVGALKTRVQDLFGVELSDDAIWVILDLLADQELLVARVTPPGGVIELGLGDEAALEATSAQLVVTEEGLSLTTQCEQPSGDLDTMRSEEETAKEAIKVARDEATNEAAELEAKEASAKDAQGSQETTSKELGSKESDAKNNGMAQEADAKELSSKEASAKSEGGMQEANAKELSTKESDAKNSAATQEQSAKESSSKESGNKETISKESGSKESDTKESESKESTSKESDSKESTAKESAAKSGQEQSQKEQSSKQAAEQAAKQAAEQAAKEQSSKQAAEQAAKEQAAKNP